MTKKVTELAVRMNDLNVGLLKRKTSGALEFNYVECWLNSPEARPVSLSLPLGIKVFEGDLVWNFFDNLLPDSDKIRTRIQQRFKVTTITPFDLLSVIGMDCIGDVIQNLNQLAN